jgi:hypothetical protein
MPIHVSVANVLAPISTIHHLLDRSRIINAQLTGHVTIPPLFPHFAKPQNRPNYGLTLSTILFVP